MTAIAQSNSCNPFSGCLMRGLASSDSCLPLFEELESASSNEMRLDHLLAIYQLIRPKLGLKQYQEDLSQLRDYLNSQADLQLIDSLMMRLMKDQISMLHAQDDLTIIASLLTYEKAQELIKYKIANRRGISDEVKSDLQQKVDSLEDTLKTYVAGAIPAIDSSSKQFSQNQGKLHSLFSRFRGFFAVFLSAHDFSPDNTLYTNPADASIRLVGLYMIVEKPVLLLKWVLDKLCFLLPSFWAPYLIFAMVLMALKMGFSKTAAWIREHSGLSYPNLSTEAMNYVPLIGFEDEVQRVINGLIHRKRHPGKIDLLLGPSGVGKTAIIKEVARRIALHQCPELDGMQVYYINTAFLQNPGAHEGPRILMLIDLLLKELQQHDNMERSIIVFDEIHNAIGERSFSGKLSEQLLEILPKINCVAITTLDHFQQIVADKSFKRRLKKLRVHEMALKDQLHLLSREIYDYYPDIEMPSEDVLRSILANSNMLEPDEAQPSKGLEFLDSCIQHVRNHPSDNEIKLRDLYKQADEMRRNNLTRGYFGFLDGHAADRIEPLNNLAEQISEKEAEVREEKSKKAQLFDLSRRIHACKERMAILANAQNRRAWVEYLLREEYFMRELVAAKTRLGVRMTELHQGIVLDVCFAKIKESSL